jgi:hypothetical protein
VVKAKATGSESEGQHSVTKRLKSSPESPPRPGSIGPDGRRILAQNAAWANRSNNPDELIAEARLGKPAGSSGPAVLLAWVAATDEVNVPLLRGSRREGMDIVMPPKAGPMAVEDPAAPWVDLDLPAALVPGPRQAKVEAADPGE